MCCHAMRAQICGLELFTPIRCTVLSHHKPATGHNCKDVAELHGGVDAFFWPVVQYQVAGTEHTAPIVQLAQ